MAELDRRIETAERAARAAQDAANQEEKSSAGDKYETGRAMAQNDRDMYAAQQAQAFDDKRSLLAVPPGDYETVRPGALVETTIGWFFVTVSVGIIESNGVRVMVASPKSPAGQALAGKKAGESVTFNGKSLTVISIH